MPTPLFAYSTAADGLPQLVGMYSHIQQLITLVVDIWFLFSSVLHVAVGTDRQCAVPKVRYRELQMALLERDYCTVGREVARSLFSRLMGIGSPNLHKKLRVSCATGRYATVDTAW